MEYTYFPYRGIQKYDSVRSNGSITVSIVRRGWGVFQADWSVFWGSLENYFRSRVKFSASQGVARKRGLIEKKGSFLKFFFLLPRGDSKKFSFKQKRAELVSVRRRCRLLSFCIERKNFWWKKVAFFYCVDWNLKIGEVVSCKETFRVGGWDSEKVLLECLDSNKMVYEVSVVNKLHGKK